jgi:hypothetical protein
MVLVQERLAEAAAAYVAANDHADPTEARLLTAEDFTATSASDTRLQALVLRILSRDATEDELTTLRDLWATLYATEGSAESAWAGVLATLFRHPDFLVY